MPLYEYACPKCDSQQEVIAASFSTPAPVCASCHVEMTKLISNPGRASFRGSGFHCTEYRAPTRGH